MDFRLDRMATLYLMSPIRRCLPVRTSVPILMYHSISEQDESNLQPYYRTATSPKTFAAQMEHLQASGYRTVSLNDIAKLLDGGGAAAEKNLVITFDDGLADFYNQAFPVLSRCGFTATMFLPTAYIAEGRKRFKEKPCLSWAEIREMHRYGISFGSHTVTHPRLVELDAQIIQQEIADSKRTIEQELGCEVESFAYPFAFPQTETHFVRMLRQLLRDAGYRNGVTTVVGRASRSSDPYFMQRLPVNSCDDEEFLMTKLSGAYDWVSVPQHLLKLIKTSITTQRPRPFCAEREANGTFRF
jgi:peptidoglycan/xylan/chitin deacetylase (PgdA/CDA1 family)